jgi:hypothetical protein
MRTSASKGEFAADERELQIHRSGAPSSPARGAVRKRDNSRIIHLSIIILILAENVVFISN